ncbi:MAG: hypothetical protein IE923_04405 [Micrococcales bacterium]|nr:hypothetical protein [Micrococcales bacterium]
MTAMSGLSTEIRARLSRLQKDASRCRGNSLPNSTERQASSALTDLVAQVRAAGVPRHEIAEALGVTPAAVTQRLRAHGYLKTPPSLSPFEARLGNYALTHCKRGHEFTPDNTRVRRSGGRDCRACDRARYAQRRGAQR